MASSTALTICFSLLSLILNPSLLIYLPREQIHGNTFSATQGVAVLGSVAAAAELVETVFGTTNGSSPDGQQSNSFWLSIGSRFTVHTYYVSLLVFVPERWIGYKFKHSYGECLNRCRIFCGFAVTTTLSAALTAPAVLGHIFTENLFLYYVTSHPSISNGIVLVLEVLGCAILWYLTRKARKYYTERHEQWVKRGNPAGEASEYSMKAQKWSQFRALFIVGSGVATANLIFAIVIENHLGPKTKIEVAPWTTTTAAVSTIPLPAGFLLLYTKAGARLLGYINELWDRSVGWLVSRASSAGGSDGRDGDAQVGNDDVDS